jgi:hypothetical protein
MGPQQSPAPWCWKVVGETTAMLTFPPNRTSVRIGNVEVALADPDQARTTPVPITTSWHTRISVSVPGFLEEAQPAIELDVAAYVEAMTPQEAFDKGQAEIERTLTSMALASGSAIRPARFFAVLPEPPAPGAGWQLTTQATGGTIGVWSPEHVERLKRVEGALATFSGEDARLIRNAVHWWSRANMAEEPHTIFLYHWFAIEAFASLSLVERTAPRKPGKKPSVSAKIAHLLATITKVWSKNECRTRYDLRCGVAHGDLIITPTEERAMNEQIPQLQDAVNAVLNHLMPGVY